MDIVEIQTEAQESGQQQPLDRAAQLMAVQTTDTSEATGHGYVHDCVTLATLAVATHACRVKGQSTLLH